MAELNRRWLLAGSFVLCVAILLSIGLYVQGAESQRTTQSAAYPHNVTFLEHNLITNGTVLNGTVPFRSVNFPNYWFNENTRELNGRIGFDLNDSLVLIFGDALTMVGNYGAGTGNELYGVYRLPVKADQATIYYADRSGFIGMYVNNQSMILRPGQVYTYNESETVRDGNGTVHIDYRHIYLNHGLIPVTSIGTSMVR